LTGQTQDQFDEFFWKTNLGRSIAKANPEMQSEFFQRYLQDFISMAMNVTSQETLQVVCLVYLEIPFPGCILITFDFFQCPQCLNYFNSLLSAGCSFFAVR